MKRGYTCASCALLYDPTSQGNCPGCSRRPHLDRECDHDCDECSSVLFPPRDGHLDLFTLIGPVGATRWQRVAKPRS